MFKISFLFRTPLVAIPVSSCKLAAIMKNSCSEKQLLRKIAILKNR